MLTNHLTNDFSKEELFVAKSNEKCTKTPTNIVHIESEKYK